MSTTGDHTDSRVRRRALLGTVGSVAGFTVAGCLGSTPSVSVLSAGSLAHTFEDHVGPAFKDETGIDVHGEYYGTNAVMRMIEDRTKHPDVVASADATLLRDRLYDEFTDWDLEFAANSVGIGYNDDTEFGRRLEDGESWYELALDADEGDLAIGDPDLDPLGYRAIQAFELAESEHDLDGFREEMLALVYKEPEEPQIMAGVESGSRAGAIVYRNMAVDHDMPFLEFPAAYNFADPELADHYAMASYTTDEEGYTAEGRPVTYNATVVDDADDPGAGHQLVAFLVDNPDLLEDAGLTVGESFPRPSGNVPEEVER
ncbi:extracellular solute-binding protein [Natronobacterium gregoryi]|uniref:ABC-type molybdate transport system, periplasmic component n=2 Tax=Natronobacterium gregoryi TaxID=44930 RepID=L0AIC5_NATGS|nr:extracellular solute-binding protein [Natronobacterium gregoryi]AFZ73561.1 ABC-type molybdate transport system, periplasmic component [Natronobacterium gregoryi SP2]ELY68228.1 extracellular solute-binding protein [Natronobacterium gregoryi SP2]PLK20539.1 sulfate ABC transporter substrate-binding protein [Natronobacterium gregoryi SP2]SFJ17738.1 tungstate/molybdate binding protein [Natronobacterium gregoryi]